MLRRSKYGRFQFLNTLLEPERDSGCDVTFNYLAHFTCHAYFCIRETGLLQSWPMDGFCMCKWCRDCDYQSFSINYWWAKQAYLVAWMQNFSCCDPHWRTFIFTWFYVNYWTARARSPIMRGIRSSYFPFGYCCTTMYTSRKRTEYRFTFSNMLRFPYPLPTFTSITNKTSINRRVCVGCLKWSLCLITYEMPFM